MAELSSDLQNSITDLQTQHTNLVKAVRDYNSGSLSAATNDLLSAASAVEDSIATKETALMGLIGYGTTKPQPSLIMDFANQVYLTGSRRIERGTTLHESTGFSRDSSATYWDASGNLKTAEVGSPRITHDPKTGRPEGLLLEGGATNYIGDPSTESNWSTSALFRHTIEAVGLDGQINTFRKFQTTGAATDHFLYYNDTNLAQPGEYTISFWMLPGEEVRPRVIFRGVESDPYPEGSGLLAVSEVSGEWEKYTYTFIVGSGESVGQLRIYLYYDGTINSPGNEDYWAVIENVQLEEGGNDSSFIPSNGAPTSRSMDIFNFYLGQEYNNKRGTLYVEFTRMVDSDNAFVVTPLGFLTPASEYIYIEAHRTYARIRCSVTEYDTVQVVSAIDTGVACKMAITYRDDGYVGLAIDGNAHVGSDSPGTSRVMAEAEYIRFMRGTGGFKYSEMRYYPFHMTEAELEDLTR